jgi:hypothetical protein
VHIQGASSPLPTRFRDFSFCGHFAGHSPPHNGLAALDSGQ